MQPELFPSTFTICPLTMFRIMDMQLLRGAAAVWEVIHPVLLLLLAAMALAGDSYNPFLYFQF